MPSELTLLARLAALRDLPNDSPAKTLLVATLLCLVCSVVVSSAAVLLQPVQERNREAERKQTILQVAGLWEPGGNVDRLFQRVEPHLVDLTTGGFVTGMDPAAFDPRRASRDPATSVPIPPEKDVAHIGRRARYARVYLVHGKGRLDAVILPVYGHGLWSTLQTYLALEGDGRTIRGLFIYDQQETPGLGAEVSSPNWRALWPGRQALDENGQVRIRVVKGQAPREGPAAAYQVDGLSGATLTGNGVNHMLEYWLGADGFGPFLKRIRQRGI